MITTVAKPRVHVVILGLLLHLRPNYIHSASNDIHTDGPMARARARYSENLLIQHISRLLNEGATDFRLHHTCSIIIIIMASLTKWCY